MLSTFPFVIQERHCFALTLTLTLELGRLTLVSYKMLAVS